MTRQLFSSCVVKYCMGLYCSGLMFIVVAVQTGHPQIISSIKIFCRVTNVYETDGDGSDQWLLFLLSFNQCLWVPCHMLLTSAMSHATYKHHFTPECIGISHSKFRWVVHAHALLQLLNLHTAPPDVSLCKTNPELGGCDAINILHVVWSVCVFLWLVFAQADNPHLF